MKSKGQGLGVQILVVVVFAALLLLLFAVFLYPESAEKTINQIFERTQKFEWKDVLIFVLIVILIIGIAVVLVMLHFTTIFEEREV